MEPQEEFEVTSQNIVKGKRTKRQRVQSPTPFSLTTGSLAGGGDGGRGHNECCENGKNSDVPANKNWSPSPTNSNHDVVHDSTTEEEEDMANCLILLAQGHDHDNSSPEQGDEMDAGITNYNVKNDKKNGSSGGKFSSRRFLETAGSGKAGYYVYECKTCSRTFPSFQALGGHRASHKKPKLALLAINNNSSNNVYKQKAQLSTLSSDEEVDGHFKNLSSLSLQLSNNNYNNKGVHHGNQYQNMKSKIHECSICGAEFTSGQALGGHMRRHRGGPVGAGSGSSLSLTPLAMESEEPQKGRNLISLDLDLNLPAPEDHDHNKLIHFASKQEQQQQQQQQQKSSPLVFSSPALVDCHY